MGLSGLTGLAGFAGLSTLLGLAGFISQSKSSLSDLLVVVPLLEDDFNSPKMIIFSLGEVLTSKWSSALNPVRIRTLSVVSSKEIVIPIPQSPSFRGYLMYREVIFPSSTNCLSKSFEGCLPIYVDISSDEEDLQDVILNTNVAIATIKNTFFISI